MYEKVVDVFEENKVGKEESTVPGGGDFTL